MADPADHATFEALWKKVTEDLDDDGPHGAFIEHARRVNLLPEAARRYRLYKDELGESADPAVLERVDKRLGGITMLAMAELDAQRTEPTPPTMGRVLTFVAVFLTVAAIIGLFRALAG